MEKTLAGTEEEQAATHDTVTASNDESPVSEAKSKSSPPHFVVPTAPPRRKQSVLPPYPLDLPLVGPGVLTDRERNAVAYYFEAKTGLEAFMRAATTLYASGILLSNSSPTID